jgi:hypothetical protein
MRIRTPLPVLILAVLLRSLAAAQTMPAMPGMSQLSGGVKLKLTSPVMTSVRREGSECESG